MSHRKGATNKIQMIKEESLAKSKKPLTKKEKAELRRVDNIKKTKAAEKKRKEASKAKKQESTKKQTKKAKHGKFAGLPNVRNARLVKPILHSKKRYEPDQLSLELDKKRPKVEKMHQLVFQQGVTFGEAGDWAKDITHLELFRMQERGEIEINYPTTRKADAKKAELPEEQELSIEEVTNAKEASYIHDFDDVETFPALAKFHVNAGIVGKRYVMEFAACERRKCMAAQNSGFLSVSGVKMYKRLAAIEGFNDALEELEAYFAAELKKNTKSTRESVLSALQTVLQRCLAAVPVMKFDFALKEMVQVVNEEGQGVWSFDATNAIKAIKVIAEFNPSILSEKVGGDEDTKSALKRIGNMPQDEVQGLIESFLSMGKK